MVENHRRPGHRPYPGAHFVGHSGQELVNLFGLAMRFGLTAAQIRDNVYAYPTFSSDIKHMLGHGA